jgi:polysaccharide export outer membrane protein
MARRGVTRSLAAVLVAALTLSGCTFLPASGPSEIDITKSANVSLGPAPKGLGIDYVLIPLTNQVLQYFQDDGARSLAGFKGGRGPAPAQLLGVGDIVQLTIFESSAGGLFIPNEAGSRPGNFVTMPQQTVDATGAIAVPYAGRIKVAGRTAQEVEADVRKALADKAIEPQAVLTLVQSHSNVVSVLGDVNNPQELSVNAGDRILDEIARAGGLSTPGLETYVTLTRGGHQATILFNTLVQNPKENIFVGAGDTIFVNRERRTYLVFGAATENGRIDFEESGLSLAEAVAKAGGLIDQRAQPSAVFDYRIVPRSALAKLGVDLSAHTGDRIPVIFQVDLRDPTGFFAAESFPMHDKDIVFISNSGATGLIKFLSVLTSVTDSAAAVTTDAVATRDSLRSLAK